MIPMNTTSRKNTGKNIFRRYNLIPVILTIIFIAAMILPETYALNFGFLGSTSKQTPVKTICKPSAGLTGMISEYNRIQLSTKLYDFIKKNRYQKIGVTVTEKKCSYQYTVTVGTNRVATIKQGTDKNVGLKISTSYENILAAKNYHENGDTFGLIKTAAKISMPIGTRIKAILFLKSYL